MAQVVDADVRLEALRRRRCWVRTRALVRNHHSGVANLEMDSRFLFTIVLKIVENLKTYLH